jgi:hybrid polyketide synthase/nonribosomal peptide synthetase ACE1
LRKLTRLYFQSTHWTYATAGGGKLPPELLQAFRQLGGECNYFYAYKPTNYSMSSSELDLTA